MSAFWDREKVADEFQRIATTKQAMFGITRGQALALADEAIAMTVYEAGLARGLSPAEAGEDAWPSGTDFVEWVEVARGEGR